MLIREGNVVHMGDVFNSRYPFIDADNGGDFEGMIRFCRAVLAQINSQTRVIPGHGEVTDYAGLAAYTTMLESVRDRILLLIDNGLTPDQVTAAQPTADYDARFGNPALFITKAYMSLGR